MNKTQVALQMSAESLAERRQTFLWTFTFAETLDIKATRARWNHLLTLLRRRWPKLCGIRVFEMHESHGLHVHLLTDRFLDVRAARQLAQRAGWGRIHVKRFPATKAGYVGKYLSKERPPCFKRWRLWAAFGKEWSWTKLANVRRNSAFTRVYEQLAKRLRWDGNSQFELRCEFVRRSIDTIVRAGSGAERPRRWMAELRESILGGSAAIIH